MYNYEFITRNFSPAKINDVKHAAKTEKIFKKIIENA